MAVQTVQTRLVDYQDQGTELQGYLAWTEGAQAAPLVLVAHQWNGRNPFTEERARTLAALGYSAFALDMYGTGVLGNGPDECRALMNPLLQDRKVLARRMNAGLEAAGSQPECDAANAAAIGYCFGGLCVLDLVRSGAPVRGVISFHGLLHAPEPPLPGPLRGSVLALSGADDPLVPIERIDGFQQEMTAAGADWQLHLYGGAMHSFAVPGTNSPDMGNQYNEAADRRSWATASAFLAEVLRD